MIERLEALRHCFQGVIPAFIATCDRAGEPNVTYLSQIEYVGGTRVALSCQFFNKTKRNVLENPLASANFYDPITFESWNLKLRYLHSETSGALFDRMALRIQAIASHTGMAGVFRLIAADVYEVLSVAPVEGFLTPPDPLLDAAPAAQVAPGPMTEIRGLQAVSERIARAKDLDELLNGALEALAEHLGFVHSMILVADESTRRLATVASRGYGEGGIGAEVAEGDGVIGTVAGSRRMVRLSGVAGELRYGRAVRNRFAAEGATGRLAPEIPLPGLCDAQALLALPLLAGDRLIGVLAVESRDPLQFDEWDEAFLQIVGNQIALGIDRMQAEDDETAAAPVPAACREGGTVARRHRFVFFRNDDCVFLDGEYLIRNVPGRILWKLLRRRVQEGQVECTNRELRLDPWLGLPPLKDNLEARLILLRRRLAEKCATVRLVPVRRGRFALEIDGSCELEERESG